jgi:hypothetical protein
MTVLCTKCGAQVEPEDKFCKACGEIVDSFTAKETSITSEVNPGFDPMLNQPLKKSRKALWISAAAVVVVLGGGTALASTLDVFASGKQVLLDVISHGGSTADSSEESWNLKIKNLNAPNVGQPAAAMLATLNNASIDLNVFFNPQDNKAELDFNTQYQSVSHHGSLWVSKDSAVLSAVDYQSLLAPVLPQGMKIPQYLVTDSDQAKSISDFWTQLSSSKSKLTADQLKSVEKMETLLISAIPDKYIHRKGLTTVEIQFDQTGLTDILKSEVTTVYSNKAAVADAISQLASLSSTAQGMSVSDIKQSVLDSFNQMPEEAVLAGISTVMNSGVVSTEPMSISVSKNLFGSGATSKVSGGISVKDPQSNTSGTVEFTVNTTAPSSKTVQMPSITNSNSQTFTNFAGQAGN